jgi:hypothetical protein
MTTVGNSINTTQLNQLKRVAGARVRVETIKKTEPRKDFLKLCEAVF